MAMTKEQASKPRNTLDSAQKYRVICWLNDYWPKVEQDRPTKDMVCAQMTNALGFIVTRSNLQFAIKMTGKRFPAADPSHTPEVVAANVTEARLRHRVSQLESSVTRLTSTLIELMNELGSETPVDLAEVVSQDTEED